MSIIFIGIDLAKYIFPVHGVNENSRGVAKGARASHETYFLGASIIKSRL